MQDYPCWSEVLDVLVGQDLGVVVEVGLLLGPGPVVEVELLLGFGLVVGPRVELVVLEVVVAGSDAGLLLRPLLGRECLGTRTRLHFYSLSMSRCHQCA